VTDALRASEAISLGDSIRQTASLARVVRDVSLAEDYDALAQVAPSPVVELNRAVAIGMAFGLAGGLAVVDAVADEPALHGYHLLASVGGHLLEQLGRTDEARVEFARAASLTRNERERALLVERAR
jgi:predicted RNA polymerase sigma factor